MHFVIPQNLLFVSVLLATFQLLPAFSRLHIKVDQVLAWPQFAWMFPTEFKDSNIVLLWEIEATIQCKVP